MPQDDVEDMLPHKEMGQLSFEEKKFLLAVERGDVATVRRYVINLFPFLEFFICTMIGVHHSNIVDVIVVVYY